MTSHAAEVAACARATRTFEDHQREVRRLIEPVFAALREASPALIPIDSPELNGRVTARAIQTAMLLPPFDNSQMDGYAVRSADLATASVSAPQTLTVGLAVAAGDPPGTHRAGTATPIMTGAAIPEGADAVVPIEQAIPPRFPPLQRRASSQLSETPSSVSFVAAVPVGQFVRLSGEDAAKGTVIVAAGAQLAPARIGAIAAAGCGLVPVRPRPRILLCSTGDEIMQNGGSSQHARDLAPGRIHDANSPMLAAALREAGAAVDLLRCPDDPEALRDVVAAKADSCDLVITSGGISAGAFEVVREAFSPFGIAFVSVAMQPGGPQGLGRLGTLFDGHPDHAVPTLCFPGNPVSAMISAECFLLPLLRDYAGIPDRRTRRQLRLSQEATSPREKHQVRRGRIESDGRVSLSAPGSHLLHDLAMADVLVHLPANQDVFPENTTVETWSFND